MRRITKLCAPLQDYMTAQGVARTEADVPLAMGNWGSIVGLAGAASQGPPANQTGPTNTTVAAFVLMPLNSGIFFCAAKMSYSDGTTAGALTARLRTKTGANTGQIAGGAAAGKFGGFAGGAGAGGLATYVGANGQVLNVDGAGGGGLTLEGTAITAGGAVTQSQDRQATLTGLLTANGQGVNNFEFIGMVDLTGPTAAAKTAFGRNIPVSFSLDVSDTAAHVVSFDSISLFAMELPVG